MGKQRSRQILGLDLLRAAAALMVMLFHYTYWNWADNPYLRPIWPAFYQKLSPYTSTGWVGVEIFFVISGFIITYSIENIGPATFVRHRITRLIPAALICATITATVLLARHSMPFPVVAELWLRGVTFWPLRPWIDGSYWTLPVEVSFYFLVFLCLSTRRRLLPLVMTVVGAASTYSNLVHVPRHFEQPFLLMLQGCFFGFGVFLYEILNQGPSLRRLCSLAICLAGCLAEIGARHQPLAYALWIGGVLFLIASVRLNSEAQKLLGQRGASVLRSIGLATYPLYLVHDNVGNALIETLHRAARIPYTWALAITMAAMIAVAGVVAQIAEPRVKAVILRLLPKGTEASGSRLPAPAYADPQISAP